MIWHSSNLQDVLTQLDVKAETGLANSVAEERLEIYGKNEIKVNEKLSLFKRILAQFKSKTLIALIIVCIVSFVATLVYDQPNAYMPLLLIGVLLANAVISAFYLYNADVTIDDIKSVSHPKIKVLRDGIEKVITADCLVRGDVIILSEGDYVSADARLIEAYELRLNESVLTGEEVPVEKDASVILEDIVSFENRANMVFAGTTVVHGTAKAVVVATATDTENGKTSYISSQIGQKQLPIEAKLDVISKFANILILAVCALVFIISLVQNFSSTQPFAVTSLNVILNALALAVAAIPEGLPAIATIVITTGLGRFLKEKIIVKDINAFETIGKTNVILADKTGVFTHTDMVLDKVFDGKELIDLNSGNLSESASILLRLGAVCSTLSNDATEKAIKKACLDIHRITEADLFGTMPKINEIPFDSIRKSMTVITMINERPFAIVKGAPEILVPKCVGCNHDQILAVNEKLAKSAYRNVCIAMRPLSEIPANPNPEEIENNLTFIGLLGLKESIRSEAFNDVKMCNKANIKTVMLTGDNLYTAKAVATELGLLTDDSQAITGAELDNMTDEELAENIEKYCVFARVSPEHKLRIARAWQSKKAIVTITGNGLSDAEALACADVGCAMGQYGADVAKGNADIIILKNSFNSLVSTIKESRGFLANIRKAVYYLCSCNLAELILIFLGVCIFKAPVLAAVQILLINLLTDSAPAISYSLEKAEQSVMKKKSFKKLRRVFDIRSIAVIMLQGLFMALAALVSFAIGNTISYETAMTMAFVTLGLAQGIHCFNNKFEGTIFKKEVFSNSFMNKSVFAEMFAVVFLAFTPVGFIFGLTIITLPQFLIALALALTILPISELLKFIKSKV